MKEVVEEKEMEEQGPKLEEQGQHGNSQPHDHVSVEA